MTAASAGEPVLDLESGGLRTLVKRNPAHEVVAARVHFRGGAANLTPATAGSEAMYAASARRGTRTYPKERLNGLLASLGAEFGASASHDATVFSLRCLRRHLDTAWDVLASIVLEPLLLPAELEVVRGQMLLDRRQMLDSPDGALGEIARRRVYAGHPYAATPHGDEASLPGLDAAALRAHVARFFTRSNALVVLAGDVSEADAERYATRLADLPPGAGPTPLPAPVHFPSGALFLEERALPTNYVLGEFAAPALRDPDHPAMLIAMSVLRDRFFEEVRTKRNLSYAPAASLGHDAANLGSVYVTATDPAATLPVMHAEMRRLAATPMPADELEHKVRTFVTRYYLQNETNQAQAGFLATYELFGSGWQHAGGLVARLEAVTPADIARVTRTYVRNIQWVVLGDRQAAAPHLFVDP